MSSWLLLRLLPNYFLSIQHKYLTVIVGEYKNIALNLAGYNPDHALENR